jgi:hypothetical protein
MVVVWGGGWSPRALKQKTRAVAISQTQRSQNVVEILQPGKARRKQPATGEQKNRDND